MDPEIRYGVRLAQPEGDAIQEAAESLRHLGFAVVRSGISADSIASLGTAFDDLHQARLVQFGRERLEAIGEADVLRCPLAGSPAFLALAANPTILALCERLYQFPLIRTHAPNCGCRWT